MLAERISEDDYRVMMGYHKPVDRAKLPPYRGASSAEDAARASQRNIIQVDQAYTILRLVKHVPAGKMTFAQVKDSLQKELQQKKTNDVRAASISNCIRAPRSRSCRDEVDAVRRAFQVTFSGTRVEGHPSTTLRAGSFSRAARPYRDAGFSPGIPWLKPPAMAAHFAGLKPGASTGRKAFSPDGPVSIAHPVYQLEFGSYDTLT